jgi:hypothetical protein
MSHNKQLFSEIKERLGWLEEMAKVDKEVDAKIERYTDHVRKSLKS